MTSNLTYTFNNDNSSDPWQDWFDAERGTELEDDVDECDYDSMDDRDDA